MCGFRDCEINGFAGFILYEQVERMWLGEKESVSELKESNYGPFINMYILTVIVGIFLCRGCELLVVVVDGVGKEELGGAAEEIIPI